MATMNVVELPLDAPEQLGVEGSIMPHTLVEANETPVMVDIASVVSAAAVLNDAVATTLAINEAVAMMAFTAASVSTEQSIILEQATMDFQPLADILARHRVKVSCAHDIAEIDESIAALDHVIAALEACEMPNAGHGPGFYTQTDQGHRHWSRHGSSAYETLALPANQVPLPTPALAIQCLRKVKSTWQVLRQIQQARNSGQSTDSFCSCFRDFDHVARDFNVLLDSVKQTMEQEMVQEASDTITSLLTRPGVSKGELWDRTYERDLLPTLAEMHEWYTPSSPVRLLRDRDDYIATFAKLAMASKSSIKVCTCYLFTFDPAHRYILLDLLPFLAQRGISVQIMFDLLTIESSVVRDAFYTETLPKDGKDPKTVPQQVSPALGRAITSMSFLEHLSTDCPVFKVAKEEPASSLEFLNQLLQVSSSLPAYQVKFWCARDATCHYRIKNHAKCILFDCSTAFIGGSNITPTVRSASSDCDLIVTGEVARQVNDTFTFLWDGMSAGQGESMAQFSLYNSVAQEEEKKNDVGPNLEEEPFQLIQDWDDVNCRIAVVRSEPSSSGEDAILRAVLGAIHAAETSVIVSMGHSNVPKEVALALHDACKRGVKVQMLHNSLYSNDLRVGQRDLFLSLRDLLQVAPDVQVWATVATCKEQPPFLHSKYVVIDGKWSCVGSWNLWTRSAFYEMEHELLIYSEQVASFLGAKFERERAATSVHLDYFDCLPGKGFCPTGCELCRPFGPFFV